MRKRSMGNLQRFIDNQNEISKSLSKMRKIFPQYSHRCYLYRKVISETDIHSKFTSEFIELIYITLVAWDMNSRGAKLADFSVFKKSILRHKMAILKLEKYCLVQLSCTDLCCLMERDVKPLFLNLNLVASKKPILVTNSKTLHFLLPHLFVPIDRKYTLKYFYNHHNISKNPERQFQRLKEILEECRRFATSVKLKKYRDKIWNANIPKTIDNIIIGCKKRK